MRSQCLSKMGIEMGFNQSVGFVYSTPEREQKYTAVYVNTSANICHILPIQADDSTNLAWSPNGKYLTYNFDGYLYLSNADGSGSRKLVKGFNPVWSPDSRYIAFLLIDGLHADHNGVFPEAYFTDLSGSSSTRLLGGHIQSVDWLQ